MTRTIRQWISRAIALALLGPLAAAASTGLKGVDGSDAHTLLTSDSFVGGIVALLIVGGLIVIGAIVGSVLDNRREGILAMGLVLGWVAWTSGRMGQVYLLSPEPGTSIRMALEGLALGAFVLLGCVFISAKDGDDPISSFSPKHLTRWLSEMPMLVAMAAALVGAGVVSLFLGSYDFPGQSTGVGFIAGIFAGVAGTMACASVQEKKLHTGTPFAPILLGVLLGAVLFPLLTAVFPGYSRMSELVLEGAVPGFAVVSPAAWIMGGLLGMPVGHSWVEHTQEKAQQGAAVGS